jgi:ribosomal protein S18 acetylase RimI-like enzyme
MLRLRVESGLGSSQRRIARGLLAYNARAVGKHDYRPLVVTLRRGKGLVGGLAGWTWMGWCHVDLLWVSKKYRGRGHGVALMRKAELEARKRGVKNVFLDSFSFQAPGFYKKLGYTEFGRLKNFPKGHTRYFLQKAL